MQLRLNKHLNLLDIVDPKGIALDLSHIQNKCKVRGFVVPDVVGEGLTAVDVLVSSTLGIAAAGYRITQSILSGLNGDPSVVTLHTLHLTRTSYFSYPVRFGMEGVEEIFPLPKFTKSQEEMMEAN